MLPTGHIRRGAHTRWGLGAMLVMLFLTSGWSRTMAADLTPDETALRAAYARVRSWIDAFDLPGFRNEDAAIPVPGMRAVCVLLRHRGRILGVGIDATGDDLMLRRAAGRALDEVLQDASISGLPESVLAEAGLKLTLEIEAAGKVKPLPGVGLMNLIRGLTLGKDGLALRRGDQWRYLFPAHLRTTNANRPEVLSLRISGLATELGCPPHTEWNHLREKYAITPYRFAALHLAQRAPHDPPFITFRGGSIVPPGAVQRADLIDLTDNLARHILNRFVRDPEGRVVGLLSAYEPATDQYRKNGDVALAAFALGRYARMPGADPETVAAALRMYDACLDWLGWNLDSPDYPLLDHAAMVILALGSNSHPRHKSLWHTAAATVRTEFYETGFRLEPRNGRNGNKYTPTQKAQAAYALTRLMVEGYDGIEPLQVRTGLDNIWNSVNKHQWIGLLPWIGWAELDYAAVLRGEIIHKDGLIEMRSLLHASQVGHPGRTGEMDEKGGFLLLGGGELKVSAQTVRPASFLATMLRVPELTPAQTIAHMRVRHLESMRFIRQLTVREEDIWMHRNPNRSLGGLRNALFDNTQSLAAQTLGLIAGVETLTSMKNEEW